MTARTGAWYALVVLALAILGVLLGPGCRERPSSEPSNVSRPTVEPLHIGAASDLQGVLPALIAEFQARHPAVPITPIFGASGQLAWQIEAGAPIDLFLAANTEFVEKLAAKGLVDPGSVRPYARGALVVVLSARLTVKVPTLGDLVQPDLKHVAIANPATAPYGAAAFQAIERAGLVSALAARIVTAESVRQALQLVQTGNADAGFVGRALARDAGLPTLDVPGGLHEPLIQSLGIVSRSPRRREAEAFARFLTGDNGRALLKEHGFDLPDGS
ncbi:MAG: molybdate ABC transporter substrate-binding protein [Isosphaeraceae bacterium]